MKGEWVLHLTALAGLMLLACADPARREASRPVLPTWATPQGKMIDPATVDRSDIIPYRKLERADFKGEQPPVQWSQYASQIGAVTCAYIVTGPEVKLEIQPTRWPDGRVTYRAMPLDLLFHSEMDRNCSWWNPSDIGLSEGYLLEHEQIHFALFEIEVRALNASLWEIEEALEESAASPSDAIRFTKRKVEEHLAKRMKGVMERSREFDRYTSMGQHPEEQARWRELVTSELAKTADR